MAFSDLTTTAEVRAIIGVSAKELPDTVLTLTIYTTELTEHLREIDADFLADYTTAYAANPGTANQIRFRNLTQAYAAYYVGALLTGAIDMFAPQTIQEARAQIQRQDEAAKALRSDIMASLARLKPKLQTVYGLINTDYTVPTATTRNLLAIAGLGTDPVTG